MAGLIPKSLSMLWYVSTLLLVLMVLSVTIFNMFSLSLVYNTFM